MSDREGWTWCNKCGRSVWALISGSGKRRISMDCKCELVSREYKDLGCMNGWVLGASPKEYLCCWSLNHIKSIIKKKLGNCLYEYTCPICKIKYSADSSD